MARLYTYVTEYVRNHRSVDTMPGPRRPSVNHEDRVFASLLHPGSYLGIFALVALTGCGLPMPEEVFIVGAGILSAQGELRPEFAFAACLAGALVGDAAMYGLGRRFGHNLIY